MSAANILTNAGYKAIDPQGMRYRYNWTEVGIYTYNDVVVADNGSSYICVVASSTFEVPQLFPSSWQLLGGGTEGPTGPTGPAGPEGPIGPTGAMSNDISGNLTVTGKINVGSSNAPTSWLQVEAPGGPDLILRTTADGTISRITNQFNTTYFESYNETTPASGNFVFCAAGGSSPIANLDTTGTLSLFGNLLPMTGTNLQAQASPTINAVIHNVDGMDATREYLGSITYMTLEVPPSTSPIQTLQLQTGIDAAPGSIIKLIVSPDSAATQTLYVLFGVTTIDSITSADFGKMFEYVVLSGTGNFVRLVYAP